MDLLRLFFRFEVENKIKYFKSKTFAKIITSALFLLVFLSVAVLIYSFFVSGFLYIFTQVETDVRQAITLFIYEVFLAVLGFLIMFSVIISGMFALFRSENNAWLLASPKFTLWPKLVLYKTLITSWMPTLILFVPAILAYNRVYSMLVHRGLPHDGMTEFTALSLTIILTALLFLLLSLNAITLSVLTLIGTFYSYLSKKIPAIKITFGRYVTVVFSLLLLLGAYIWTNAKSVDLVRIFKAYEMDISINLSAVSSHFASLPTNQFALLLVKLQSNMPVTEALIMIIATGVISTIIWLMISKLHYPLWQTLQENSVSISAGKELVGYRFDGGIISTLFKKEALVTRRNLKGIAWFFFLFSIWLIQIGTNKILGRNIIRYSTDINQKLILMQTIEFVIAIYFISAFALRFVFPSFSVEKRTAWILQSAPIDFKKLFFGKYFFYVLLFLIVGITMAYISQLALLLPLVNGIYGMILFITASVTIVTLAMSLGVYLPSTETDDPESITTSMGGLFFTALSLLYGSLASYTLYLSLNTASVLPITSFVAISISFVLLLLYMSPRRGFFKN